jgi:hypothetical protein
MKIDWKLALYISSLSVLISPLAQAQFCGLTNASLNGSYGYVASEAGTVVTSGTGTTGTGSTGTTGTGTTGTAATNSYSTTDLGQLLGGIAAGNQLALGGVLTFDGAGNVNGTSTPGGTAMHVGTYNVNSDCSVALSLSDPFGTNTAVTQLAGVVLGRGAEIDLTSAASLRTSATGSTSTTTTGTATTSSTTTSGSGLAIKLVRVLYQNGCSDSNLTGLYGFVLNPTSIQTEASSTTTTGTGTTGTGTTGTGTSGTGTTATGTGATTTASEPSAVIGYLEFDGAGHIVALSSMSASTSTASTFTALQYTGTYSVNSDCSGTMKIGNSSSATGTATTTTGSTTSGTSGSSQSLTLNFVITPPQAPGGGAFAPAPGLDLSFSTADESGSGYALAQ